MSTLDFTSAFRLHGNIESILKCHEKVSLDRAKTMTSYKALASSFSPVYTTAATKTVLVQRPVIAAKND